MTQIAISIQRSCLTSKVGKIYPPIPMSHISSVAQSYSKCFKFLLFPPNSWYKSSNMPVRKSKQFKLYKCLYASFLRHTQIWQVMNAWFKLYYQLFVTPKVRVSGFQVCFPLSPFLPFVLSIWPCPTPHV